MKVISYFIVFLLSLALSIAIVESTSCAAGSCAGVACAEVRREDCGPDAEWVANYGPCGCCPGCVKLLEYGQPCFGISDATEVCGYGLVCKLLNKRDRRTRCGFPDFE